ncbi:MAG: vanadium-dependent haloperoxidase [Acidimicrobiales bacterium]
MRRRILPLLPLLLAVMLLASACSNAPLASVCADDSGHSVARRWNEQLLDAIRRDTPSPTVHARNLFHVSAAMWDAWAAYDEGATALFVDAPKRDIGPERDVTVAYAAYTVLGRRYRNSVGGTESLAAFDAELSAQCLEPVSDDIGDAALLGVDIGETILEQFRNDGAFEFDAYVDLSYVPVNESLVVAEPGAGMIDPDRWQPLELAKSVTQNDQEQVSGTQQFLGPQWGTVVPFALEPSDVGLPVDPGPPPLFAEDPAAYADAAIEVLRYQQTLDTAEAGLVDVSPATLGNNPLGSNDGSGHASNPATGEPYEPNLVSQADFGRVVAEFWADGPNSETPPGHWNTLANEVSDDIAEYRFRGEGPAMDRLEWDLKLYLTLNGAMHDAAIAAWGSKRYFDSARPISMIRQLAEMGQSTDPNRARYHPDGLPLIDDEIELVTEASAADYQLAPGTIAVRAWAGHPELHADRDGVTWIDATTWVPYQLSTFVTPSFPGYVSGHSAFSRAGAEVMTAFTGDAYFPNGMGRFTAPAAWLRFDDGPAEHVTLEWATYADAADQAGESRMYGGIHISADDIAGRFIGAECGQLAVAKAFALFQS